MNGTKTVVHSLLYLFFTARRVQQITRCGVLLLRCNVEAITRQYRYVYILWESDCIRGVRRMYYRVSAGKQTACSFISLSTSLELYQGPTMTDVGQEKKHLLQTQTAGMSPRGSVERDVDWERLHRQGTRTNRPLIWVQDNQGIRL